MECCRRRYFHFQHIPQHTLRLSPFFSSNTLTSYFPCAELLTGPAMRFTDLFLIRERRWKAEHIMPYMS
ncbi:hypothetical protein BGY98DRAFT_1053485, partial [Russula aff. rugulosa BPL654]